MPGWIRSIIVATLIVASAFHLASADEQRPARVRVAPLPPGPVRPKVGDDTTAALQHYEKSLLAKYGGKSTGVPLSIKAAHFEWVLRRYHIAPTGQAHVKVVFSVKPDVRPVFAYNTDNSTWNGALLAAMSYKYAVTKDRDTLALIGKLVDGMHFYQKATGKPGLAARCVIRQDKPIKDVEHRFVDADGTVYFCRPDPAKGTYNQILCGYAALMMHAYADLPADKQKRAREDMAALSLHLVKNDYRITGVDGKPTPYGDLRPLISSHSVPFNAQVAYLIVAAATYYPPANAAIAERLRKEYRRLKNRHHVYYENPLTHLICPQRVAANPLIKGTNDRNHVVNAAFTGLMLELTQAKQQKRKPDDELLYQLGRTIFWAMEAMHTHRNALCNFMWAGLLSDPYVFRKVVPDNQGRTRKQLAYVTATAFEQLRRYPVDRFAYIGKKHETKTPQWVDARKPHDSYFWKSGPYGRWEITGPTNNVHVAAIDYLYAYWLMRYFRLDER